MNTKAIQRAVDDCAGKGGGMVIIPAGVFRSGSVEMKSHVTLFLLPGCVLRGSDNLDDYPPNPFHHNEMKETRSLLWAIGKIDIRITGGGEIDLNDCCFIDYEQFRSDEGMAHEVVFNERQREESTAKDLKRPTQPIFFHDCQGLRMDGVTVRNSPCWSITASCSRDIKITSLIIKNNLRAPNSDGIHICSSRDVVISDSIFSCGDDCIAVTGITSWETISENIVISNCIMTSRSAALRFGHLASKVRNVVVSNLVITDTNRGIAIFAGKCGWVENVVISNVLMDTRQIAGAWWGKGEPLVISGEDTGRIDGISVNNVRSFSDNGVVIASQNASIRNIELRDWILELRFGNNRALFKQMFDVLPGNPIPSPDPARHIPSIYAIDVNGLRIRNFLGSRKAEGIIFSIEPITNRVTGLELKDCVFSLGS